jgi:hypothetical protein
MYSKRIYTLDIIVHENHSLERHYIIIEGRCGHYRMVIWFSQGTPVSSTNNTDRGVKHH